MGRIKRVLTLGTGEGEFALTHEEVVDFGLAGDDSLGECIDTTEEGDVALEEYNY